MITCSLLISFLEKIKADQTTIKQTTINYIAIGCANRRHLEGEENYSIDPNQPNNPNFSELLENENQQYPLFLNDAKSKFPDVNINLFLIDPALEKIPMCVRQCIGQKSLNFVGQDWVLTQKKSKDEYIEGTTGGSVEETTENQKSYEIYDNFNQKIKVFAVRSSVNYAPHDCNESECNITLFFELLNMMSKQYGWLTFISDFTGRTDMKETDNYFTEQLEGNRNKIIYGLFDNPENLCFGDMRQIKFCFISEHNEIGVFNPNNYNNPDELMFDYNQLILQHKLIKDDTTVDIITNTMHKFITNIKNYILNILIQVLRQLILCINGNDVKILLSKKISSYNELYDLINHNNYTDAYFIVENDLYNKLLCLQICFPNILRSNKINELLKTIKYIDPYSISNAVEKMLEKY